MNANGNEYFSCFPCTLLLGYCIAKSPYARIFSLQLRSFLDPYPYAFTSYKILTIRFDVIFSLVAPHAYKCF